MIQFRLILVFILFLPTIAGCTNSTRATTDNTEELYQADRSCSYFYFLWGTHAEHDQRFDEALEAFEKALICDPAAGYIEKKIPVLLFRLGETEKAAELLKEAIKHDPEDLSQYLLLAHLSIQQNKRDEAIELYREVLKRDPANEGVLLRLGILSVQQSHFEEAEKLFRDLIEHNPSLYFARVYLARLLQMRENTTEAAEAYEEALRLNWSPELVFEMVDFYTSQSKFEDVLRLYTTVIDNDNTNERAILGRVQTLLNLGKNEEALSDLRNLRELNENTLRLDMAIAKIMLRLGKIDEASTILETLREGEVASEAHYLLGLISFQARKNDTALQYLQAIAPDSEEYADGIYLQVRILRDLDMHGRALELLKEATENPLYHHPLFYALLASLYQEQGKVDEAMASITAGTTAFPTNEQLHFEHALLLERSGLHHKALTAMQRVLELSPDHPEALNFIGYTWADQNINLEQAFQYIQRAAELKPDNGFIRDSLGWVYFRLGNFDNALEELLQALTLEPEDPHIYVHLGDVYRALNRTEDARKAYMKGLEMFDDELDKGALQKKLDELQKN
jgi:tetratricopeptide (TPR) repeat protein